MYGAREKHYRIIAINPYRVVPQMFQDLLYSSEQRAPRPFHRQASSRFCVTQNCCSTERATLGFTLVFPETRRRLNVSEIAVCRRELLKKQWKNTNTLFCICKNGVYCCSWATDLKRLNGNFRLLDKTLKMVI